MEMVALYDVFISAVIIFSLLSVVLALKGNSDWIITAIVTVIFGIYAYQNHTPGSRILPGKPTALDVYAGKTQLVISRKLNENGTFDYDSLVVYIPVNSKR